MVGGHLSGHAPGVVDGIGHVDALAGVAVEFGDRAVHRLFPGHVSHLHAGCFVARVLHQYPGLEVPLFAYPGGTLSEVPVVLDWLRRGDSELDRVGATLRSGHCHTTGLRSLWDVDLDPVVGPGGAIGGVNPRERYLGTRSGSQVDAGKRHQVPDASRVRVYAGEERGDSAVYGAVIGPHEDGAQLPAGCRYAPVGFGGQVAADVGPTGPVIVAREDTAVGGGVGDIRGEAAYREGEDPGSRGKTGSGRGPVHAAVV